MTIQIYKSGEVTPLEEWVDYPAVPNVGDRIAITGRFYSVKVMTRMFSKNTGLFIFLY